MEDKILWTDQMSPQLLKLFLNSEDQWSDDYEFMEIEDDFNAYCFYLPLRESKQILCVDKQTRLMELLRIH